MNNTLFECLDYREYLNKMSKDDSWGGKSRWAEAICCQRAYISKVLNGHANFSIEQAWGLANYLELRKDEKEYFLNLVQFERAGTQDLKKYFKDILKKIRSENLILSKKFADEKKLPFEALAKFYSSWHFSAIHLYISIKGHVSSKLIANELNILREKVDEVIEFLFKTGLIIKELNRDSKKVHVKVDFKSTFLARTSPFIINHHMNWRTKALYSLQQNLSDNIHYSAVVSLTKDDVVKIKKIIVNSIEDFRNIMSTTSNETQMHALAIDFIDLLAEK